MNEKIPTSKEEEKTLNVIKSCLAFPSQLAQPESNTVNHFKDESFSKKKITLFIPTFLLNVIPFPLIYYSLAQNTKTV